MSQPQYADCWFHANRFLNAYRGCEFGCVYCDGRSETYHIDDFSTRVRAKINAAAVLRKELEGEGFLAASQLESESMLPFLGESPDTVLKERRGIVIGVSGGVSDAYQPAEAKFRITREVLETILDFRLPVFVLTKSTQVLRDLDLLKEIHRESFVNVCFTITLVDEDVRAVFEPKSAATWERFEALKEIRKNGLHGGVMAIPIIPGIGTTEDNIRGFARLTKRAGGEFIQFGGLTLKPGRQKEYFMSVVRRRFPAYHEMLTRIYENNDPYGNPIRSRLPVHLLLFAHRICSEEGIRDRSVRHRPPWESRTNHRVLSSLLGMIFVQTYVLGERYSRVEPLRNLAAAIEQGTSDLAESENQDRLADVLGLTEEHKRLVSDLVAGRGPSIVRALWERAQQQSGER
ncbi:MAG: radical SAM protein [Candidatus Thorarchaeota archaeon]